MESGKLSEKLADLKQTLDRSIDDARAAQALEKTIQEFEASLAALEPELQAAEAKIAKARKDLQDISRRSGSARTSAWESGRATIHALDAELSEPPDTSYYEIYPFLKDLREAKREAQRAARQQALNKMDRLRDELAPYGGYEGVIRTLDSEYDRAKTELGKLESDFAPLLQRVDGLRQAIRSKRGNLETLSASVAAFREFDAIKQSIDEYEKQGLRRIQLKASMDEVVGLRFAANAFSFHPFVPHGTKQNHLTADDVLSVGFLSLFYSAPASFGGAQSASFQGALSLNVAGKSVTPNYFAMVEKLRAAPDEAAAKVLLTAEADRLREVFRENRVNLADVTISTVDKKKSVTKEIPVVPGEPTLEDMYGSPVYSTPVGQ